MARSEATANDAWKAYSLYRISTWIGTVVVSPRMRPETTDTALPGAADFAKRRAEAIAGKSDNRFTVDIEALQTAFSKQLAKEIGLYRTVGWAEATWPLNEGRLDESDFMYDAFKAMEDRERIFVPSLPER